MQLSRSARSAAAPAAPTARPTSRLICRAPLRARLPPQPVTRLAAARKSSDSLGGKGDERVEGAPESLAAAAGGQDVSQGMSEQQSVAREHQGGSGSSSREGAPMGRETQLGGFDVEDDSAEWASRWDREAQQGAPNDDDESDPVNAKSKSIPESDVLPGNRVGVQPIWSESFDKDIYSERKYPVSDESQGSIGGAGKGGEHAGEGLMGGGGEQGPAPGERSRLQ